MIYQIRSKTKKHGLHSVYLILILTSLIHINIFTNLASQELVWSEYFETGYGDWYPDKGVWQIGQPTYGLDSGYNSANCAATVLDGRYPPYSRSRLISPKINLPAITGEEALQLRFWHFFRTSSADWGTVQISVNEGEWRDLIKSPTPFGRWSYAWTQYIVDLSAFADSTIQLGFYFYSDHGGEDWGWFIDNVFIIKGTFEFDEAFFEDFENGYGDWYPDKGVWQFGQPTYGLDSGYKSTDCASTVLDGRYPPYSRSRLISPKINLPAIIGEEALQLRFWHFFRTSSADWGTVQISVNGGEWRDLIESPDTFCRWSYAWTQYIVDLSSFADSTIQLGFYFYSDHGGEDWGWFLDNVSIIKGIFKFTPPHENFETGIGNWYASKGVWEVGKPSFNASEGQYCAGTVIDGDYPPYSNSRLISPEITLIPEQGQSPKLRFCHQFSTASSADWGVVQICENDGEWEDISPKFSLWSSGWTPYIVDLSTYAYSKVKIGFLFHSDHGGGNSGWFIDEVNIEGIGSNELPIIDSFTATPDSGTVPLKVSFNCEAHDNDGYVAAYNWDFDGDGVDDKTTSTKQTTFTYTESGTYTARCIVVDDKGATSLPKYVKIEVKTSPPNLRKPRITSITDVPNDHGKQVLCIWQRSKLDSAGSDTAITTYGVWRRVDHLPVNGAANPAGNLYQTEAIPNIKADSVLYVASMNEMLRLVSKIKAGTQFVISVKKGTDFPTNSQTTEIWTFVGSLLAMQSEQYSLVVPTLFDSTKDDGIVWSTFFVSAHTQWPAVWWASQPDSGYSVNNLSPDDPTGFQAKDGDETDVSDWHQQPHEYALHQNYPNPFNPATTIKFDLPESARVKLTIFNMNGQEVRTLLDNTLNAGVHSVSWDAHDNLGNIVPSGIYFYKLSAGNSTWQSMKKMLLIK